MVKARNGLESAICLAISRVVFKGLAVVINAPRDMTERQTRGKEREFGDRMRMTWPLRTPHLEERENESESTADQRSEYDKWRPFEASMKAVVVL